nr:translation initiation factor IF-2-like [Aegilops tauschii subsp. strangulata]
MTQVLPLQLEAYIDFMPDRDASNVADPDLGSAALEDDATGGGGGAGGSAGGGGVEDWSNDDEEEEEVSRRPPPADRMGPSSSAAPTAPGGGSKRRGVLLFSSHPKKPKHSAAAAKNMAVATKRRKAAAKAAKFQKAPKQPPMGDGGLHQQCRIDPAADLREAQERNAREVRKVKEAAAKKAEADKAAAAKAAQEDADSAAKKRAEDAARQQIPQLITPLCSAPPAPEFSAPAGGAGDKKSIGEREGGDVVLPELEVPPRPPTADAQSSQPAAPLVTPVGGELVMGSGPTSRTPVRRRVEKAASAPRPMEVRSASSSAPEADSTSVAPTEWVHGGGTSALIKAAQDVQANFKAKPLPSRSA